jgi:guanylate kinase
VITSTTRSPREGEINGVHYHFFSTAEFEEKVEGGQFLEWAWVHGDRRYGTLAASVLEPLAQGRDLVMSVDVQGVASFRRAAETRPALRRALVTVFIVVDRPRLLARIHRRGQDDEAETARRMATADVELSEAPKFDFIIESRTRNEDFAALLAILKQARRRAAKPASG